MLWLNTSGGFAARISRARSMRPLPRKSGVRISIFVPGLISRIAVMQSTKWAAPPSRRSAQDVARAAGDHHVLLARVLAGLGQVRRLGRVRRLRAAGGDVAERAAAGADLAEDHERAGAVAEALVDVRAAGLLAHREQAVL